MIKMNVATTDWLYRVLRVTLVVKVTYASMIKEHCFVMANFEMPFSINQG